MIPYLSLDVETGGLDPDVHSLLEISAIYDDGSSLTKFNALVNPGTFVIGEWALAQHTRSGLLQEALESGRPEEEVLEDLSSFIGGIVSRQGGKKITVAGKNPHFDVSFLKKSCELYEVDGVVDQFHHRMLDVGSLYAELGVDSLLSLPDLARVIGMPDEFVAKAEGHRAEPDALAVIALIRRKLS